MSVLLFRVLRMPSGLFLTGFLPRARTRWIGVRSLPAVSFCAAPAYRRMRYPALTSSLRHVLCFPMAAFGRLFCYLDPQILRGFRISAPPRGGVFGCRGVRGEGHISGSAICRGLMCEWGLAHRRGAWLAWVGVWLVCLCCWASVWWLRAYVRAVAGTFGTLEWELAHWRDGWGNWRGSRQHWHSAAPGCATGSNRGGLSGVVLKILKCQPWSIAVMGCASHPVCVAEFYWKMDHERRQHHKDQ